MSQTLPPAPIFTPAEPKRRVAHKHPPFTAKVQVQRWLVRQQVFMTPIKNIDAIGPTVVNGVIKFVVKNIGGVNAQPTVKSLIVTADGTTYKVIQSSTSGKKPTPRIYCRVEKVG